MNSCWTAEFLSGINGDCWVFSIGVGCACSPSLNWSKAILGCAKISGWVRVDWPNWVNSCYNSFVVWIGRWCGWSGVGNSIAASTSLNTKQSIAISCCSSSRGISQCTCEFFTSCSPRCGFTLVSRLKGSTSWPFGRSVSIFWPWSLWSSSSCRWISHLFELNENKLYFNFSLCLLNANQLVSYKISKFKFILQIQIYSY